MIGITHKNLEVSIYCMSKKVEEHLEEALKNIREDRKITRELLDDAIKYVAKDEDRSTYTHWPYFSQVRRDSSKIK